MSSSFSSPVEIDLFQTGPLPGFSQMTENHFFGSTIVHCAHGGDIKLSRFYWTKTSTRPVQ
jgi:hypothetical protein